MKIIQKAHVLLTNDETIEQQSETDIAINFHHSTRAVERIRKDFCERGMAICIPKPWQPRSDK